FVMELLSNEYYLVGPVVQPIKRNGCSLDCKGRMIEDTSRIRKRVDDQRNGVCGCARFPKSPRQDLKSPREESRRTFIVDRPEDSELIFHSTRISADERDDADRRREFDTDVSDIQDYRRRRDIEMEQRNNYAEPIPGPSRKVLRVPSLDPARNAKKARVEDQRVERADEKEDETTTEEEDMDCICNAEVVTRDELSRIRPPDRSRVIRNGRRRNDAEENEEDIKERIKDDEEDEEERVEEEDEDTEDSIYDELRTQVPRRRTAARERELRRWIRRCREECERRGGR
ncbi:PREDICTED: zinc finger CCCH domain-containing protein 18-like, partial [Trachymyrmex cornetzi]|uniref:zinc finger CCCH domain-containing protein 18-like n=1 Tax=Trachymyrmex cornetzi TaxID=471704 RepID=UPI00084F7853